MATNLVVLGLGRDLVVDWTLLGEDGGRRGNNIPFGGRFENGPTQSSRPKAPFGAKAEEAILIDIRCKVRVEAKHFKLVS